jgi:hypothetical protein
MSASLLRPSQRSFYRIVSVTAAETGATNATATARTIGYQRNVLKVGEFLPTTEA